MKYVQDLITHIDDAPSRQRNHHYEIKDDIFWDMYEKCKKYSMVQIPGFYNLYQSLKYIKGNEIAGCLVECGCFLGGVAAFMGLMRNHLGLEADIILFDTFDGPPPNVEEQTQKLPDYYKQVQDNIREIVGSKARYKLVRGLVEDTIPTFRPRNLSLLRLDTDFYSSTKTELEYLYPFLSPGGVLIVDDYGLFEGSRRATDEFLASEKYQPLMNRIDGGVWAGVKPTSSESDVHAQRTSRPAGRLRRLLEVFK